jgi:murein DD-endopeptidase MepM/ murein hydrolase activator NlpD
MPGGLMGRHTSSPQRRPSPRPAPAPIPFAELRARYDDVPAAGHRAPANKTRDWARLGMMTAVASTVVLTTGAGLAFAHDPAAANPRTTAGRIAALLPGATPGPTSAPPTGARVAPPAAGSPTGTATGAAAATVGDPRQRLVVPGPRFTTPVVGAAVTTCFCMRWGKFHDGIDLAAPLGTPIHAAGAGTVVKVGPMSGYGLTIFIRHSNGDVSFYGHMARVFVKLGQRVTTGQVIAPVGNEGFSTGPHLHFSVYRGGVSGPAIDPKPWLAARGVKV